MRYPNSKPIADLIAQTYCFNSKKNAKMGYRAEEEFVEKNRGLCGSQLRTRRIVFLAITAATKDEKILKIVNIGGKGGRMRLPYSIVAKTNVIKCEKSPYYQKRRTLQKWRYAAQPLRL
jgi:hypothetical protein